MPKEELFEVPEFGEVVTIEITKPLPDTAVAGSIYKVEGIAKVAGLGAPPWIYTEVRFKEWYKPEMLEEVSYGRGFPMPITGGFSIDFEPDKEGDYQVTLVATPAPLSLPVIGVFPLTGKSDMMKVSVGEKPDAVFRFSGVKINGIQVQLTDHDIDSGLLFEKTTADYLDILPAYQWIGASNDVTISIKAGYKDWIGGFSPKSDAYTLSFTLPESPTIPYSGEIPSPIRVPLTACAGITDGAIEVVAKMVGVSDYISRIWNVYFTKVAVKMLQVELLTLS